MKHNRPIVKKIIGIIIALTLLLTMTACQDNKNTATAGGTTTLSGEGTLTEQQKVFEEFWALYDRHYPLFNRKGIDWQGVYTKYFPQITKETTDEQLFDIFRDIMATIDDGHSHLTWAGEFAGAKDYTDPGIRKMLEDNRSSQVTLVPATKDNPYISYGTLANHENIGYIHAKNFEPVTDDDKEYKAFQKITDEALNFLKDKEAIVMDVRDNGGGQGFNAGYLAGRFVSQPSDLMRTRVKTAPGSDASAFGPWLTDEYRGVKDSRAEGGFIGHTEPKEFSRLESTGDFQYTKPVVVLTSRATASAAEYFTLMMRSQEHVVSVGNTTMGIFAGSEHVTLKNGGGKWVTRLSVHDIEFMDKGTYKSFEGIGVPPNHLILPTPEEIEAGKDVHIDKAIEHIQGKVSN